MASPAAGKPASAPTAEDRAKRAPLTGVLNVFDALRHLIQHGAGASEAIRAELLAAVDRDDPAAADPGAQAEAQNTDPKETS